MYATIGRTESGDSLPVLLWPLHPTDEMVDAAYRERLPDEYDEVGFVHWEVVDAEEVP